ncbi:MAG: Mu-like prophage major head subunit gpT family protein [Deltaproteobacteria bacterium]|nr:Mu-like prophage major head subunit gpT family protein [Deltaproteobacteria bacterium]
MLPILFSMKKSKKSSEKDSSAGALGDFEEFTGTVGYDDTVQGYDRTYTFTEKVKGMKIERKLRDDDQYQIINRRPKQLAYSATRTREKDGAAIFNNAFTSEPSAALGGPLDSSGNPTELCASDHYNVGNHATQSNEGTSALSATSVEATRRLMAAFTGDQGEVINVNMDTILAPLGQEETAWEIINSKGKIDTADNNANFHFGKYKLIVWKNFLTDSNNWFAIDMDLMKDFLLFWDRIPLEFFQDSDSDTLVAKYIAYMRYGIGWSDWRWVYGHKVT